VVSCRRLGADGIFTPILYGPLAATTGWDGERLSAVSGTAASCHTLRRPNASGKVGPNLDYVSPRRTLF